MGAPLELAGMRFGRLLVTERAENRTTSGGKPRTAWICVCDCGNQIIATTSDLRAGDVRSCGCLQRDLQIKRATKHGGKGTRLYGIWKAMRRRCNDKSSGDYERYGGRGISVCDEWENDFAEFRSWAINNGYDDNLTIDRVDTDGNYTPQNCRWVDMKTQCNNRSSNRNITYEGETHTIKEWSDITGISYSTLYMRLRNGWSIECALAT